MQLQHPQPYQFLFQILPDIILEGVSLLSRSFPSNKSFQPFFLESSLLSVIVLNPREIAVNKKDLPLPEPTEEPLYMYPPPGRFP